MHQMSGRVVGSGAKGAPVFEAMEPRLLLDSHPLITEFMASNGSYLETRIRADAGDPFEGEPDTPDWIEIYNPTDSAVSLDGYFLTDDAEDPAQWAFPSGVTLASGEYLIVYATGEDITDPALDETGRYHTNFGLSASGGEDCVLSYYDTGLGQYVAVTEFLDFPEQERDISFGLYEDQDVTPIAPAHSLADILVPTAATSTSWYTEGYTPSGWMVGETGVGFENSIPGIFTTLYKAKSGVSVGDLAAAEAMIANPSQQAAVYTDVTSWVNFYDTGSGHGHDSASEVPFPGVSDADDYATVSVGEVTIPAAGTYTFAVNSDDGFRLTLTGGSVTGTYADGEATLGSDWFAHEAPRGTADTLGAFYFPAAGAYPFELVWYERGGGAEVEVWGAAGTRTSGPSAVELVGNTAEGGLEARYNPGAGGAAAGGYTDDIHTDIEAEMYGQNDSVYLRVAFDVTDPGAYDSLYLRMKYDDGFVAYLNGTKVAARNAPASPAWDSSATDVHPNSEAVAWADINISGHLGLLHPGTNVLAIQGLNAPTDDKDLLLLPELADIDSAGLSEFYFATASPGGPNLDAYVAVVADTKFDHDRGFYDAPFDVAITSDTEGAEIYWTLNGNSPLDADGTPSPDAVLYDAGDPDAVPHVTGSAVLRAVALKENYLPTNVDTQTYIFLDGVIHQPANPDGFPGSWGGTGADYEMDTIITEDPEYAPLMMDSLTSVPTMSLVMDLDDLFGASQGIYANPWSEGAGWERPGSLEMFYPDGYDAPDDGFQVNAGVRMYGGVGRREDCLKHSFRVLFKGDYGPTKLNYSLFGGDAAEQFDTIILRSNFNDGYSWHWGSPKDVQHIRDEYARRISTLLGARAPTGNFVHLYINGLYWG
ncbi:MAG: lamin tail domain-containing protein, partial [Phycisphaerae bacterium]